MLTPRERRLLEKLAAEGKPTELVAEEIKIARELVSVDLVCIARDTEAAKSVYAVITPKGRHALQKMSDPPKKKPLGFLE